MHSRHRFDLFFSWKRVYMVSERAQLHIPFPFSSFYQLHSRINRPSFLQTQREHLLVITAFRYIVYHSTTRVAEEKIICSYNRRCYVIIIIFKNTYQLALVTSSPSKLRHFELKYNQFQFRVSKGQLLWCELLCLRSSLLGGEDHHCCLSKGQLITDFALIRFRQFNVRS